MTDVERQRRLVEFAALDGDAGGLTAKRLPSVGADRKVRRQRPAMAQANPDNLVFRADLGRVIVEPGQVGR